MIVTLSEKYNGPFPHPSVLTELNKVVENGGERAFWLTEKEQEHRHAMEEAGLKSIIKHRDKEALDRRLIIILVFVSLSLSCWCIYINNDWPRCGCWFGEWCCSYHHSSSTDGTVQGQEKRYLTASESCGLFAEALVWETICQGRATLHPVRFPL